MTDEQIIKALPFLAKYCKNEYNDIRVDKVLLGASDLINRQKAESENQSENFKRLVAEHRKLQTNYSSMQSTLAKMSMGVEQAKAEAIKEFAERLKARARMPIGTLYGKMVYIKDIDNLVKEMVGEG